MAHQRSAQGEDPLLLFPGCPLFNSPTEINYYYPVSESKGTSLLFSLLTRRHLRDAISHKALHAQQTTVSAGILVGEDLHSPIFLGKVSDGPHRSNHSTANALAGHDLNEPPHSNRPVLVILQPCTATASSIGSVEWPSAAQDEIAQDILIDQRHQLPLPAAPRPPPYPPLRPPTRPRGAEYR